MRPSARCVCFFVLCLWGLAGVVRAQTIYDPATQWDNTNNPSLNGPWSYGYKLSVTGGLTLFTTSSSSTIGGATQVYWYFNSPLGVGFNTSATTAWTDGPTTINPRQLNLHPSVSNQMPVLRFTAPFTGTFTFSGNLSGNSGAGTTTTAYFVQNSTTFLTQAVTGFNTSYSFSSGRSLTMDERPDRGESRHADAGIGERTGPKRTRRRSDEKIRRRAPRQGRSLQPGQGLQFLGYAVECHCAISRKLTAETLLWTFCPK